MPNLPPKFNDWPSDAVSLSIDKIIELYANGFAGAKHDPIVTEEYHDHIRQAGGWVMAGDAADDFGLAGSGAGLLVVPFVHIERLYPGSLPGPAQERGSCVAHSQKNACLQTKVCEVVAGKPDEVTGKIEAAPAVSPEGIRNGVLSTEAIYWFRRHGGDGWQCESAAKVVTSESGLWLRQSYPELGIDLTNYSGRLEGQYGSRLPPQNIQDAGKLHLIRTSTRINSFEELRDFLHNGYGVSTCGSEGFSNQRNEDGVSSRRGSWAHAMAFIGVDDRAETKAKYGEPLVCVLNSWARWNSGPRRIMGTTIDIPEGAFWAKWSDVKRRSMIAFSGVNGWPAQKLPDLGFNAWG